MAKLSQELQNYMGTNVKPTDFDEYWEKALSLLENHNPKLEIVKAETQFNSATCYHLYFIGVGGSKIHAKYLVPKQNANDKAILQFHGYMYYSGSFSEKLSYVSEGYSVISMDCRGQGGPSEDLGSTKGTTIFGHVIKGLSGDKEDLYYKNVFLDTALLSKIVKNFDGINDIYTMGLSQGGALSLVCAALSPYVSKVAVQNPFLSDYKKIWEMGASRDNYRLIDYFRLFDPFHETEDEVFNKLGYIDVHNFANKIKAKVLFGTGEKDDVCPIYTQMAIYNNLTCEKNLLLYPDFAHEDMPMFWDKALIFFNED